MKRLSFTAAIVLCAMFCNAQQPNLNGYGGMAAAWVPGGDNNGWMALQLTVGREFNHTWYAEYNQTITLSPQVEAPKLIQARAGMIYTLDKAISLRPFIGYSITSVPASLEHRIGHGACLGASLVQYVSRTETVYIKYELSVNNRFLVVPSIGVMVKF